MKNVVSLFLVVTFFASFIPNENPNAWIRINWLGYKPTSTKVAVWCSKNTSTIKDFELVDATTNKIVFTGSAGKAFGSYGPFAQTYRLNFSSFKKPGKYYLQTGSVKSPEFKISDEV